MRSVLNPFQFVVITIAGWMNQHQQQVVDYLLEENRVLREQIGSRRMRFNDDQRRRLAVKAKTLVACNGRIGSIQCLGADCSQGYCITR